MSPGMLAVDVGGTFTDVIGVRDGKIEAVKVPSQPEAPEQSVLEGAQALGADDRSVFNHASTVGLNAVITRKLPKIGVPDHVRPSRHARRRAVLAAARGADRSGLAALVRRCPGAAGARYLRRGVRERMLATGEVLIELDEAHARAELERCAKCGIEGVAICLINAYVNPAHEVGSASWSTEVLGDIPCSISRRCRRWPRSTRARRPP